MRLTFNHDDPDQRFEIDGDTLRPGECTEVSGERGQELLARYPDRLSAGGEGDAPKENGGAPANGEGDPAKEGTDPKPGDSYAQKAQSSRAQPARAGGTASSSSTTGDAD